MASIKISLICGYKVSYSYRRCSKVSSSISQYLHFSMVYPLFISLISVLTASCIHTFSIKVTYFCINTILLSILSSHKISPSHLITPISIHIFFLLYFLHCHIVLMFYKYLLINISSFLGLQFIVPLPTQRAGGGLLFLPVSVFVRSFDTLWFLNSHSWTKPHRILHFGTVINPIKTLLGIVRHLPSPIFDLVITYFLSLHIAFRTLIPELNHIGSCLLAQL